MMDTHALSRPPMPPNVRPRAAMTRRNLVGRYLPKSVSDKARRRFGIDRREGYLRRIGSEPDERQALIIQSMVAAEWSALKLEFEASIAETGKEKYGRLRLLIDDAQRRKGIGELLTLNRTLRCQ